jgi:hypothetical protein
MTILLRSLVVYVCVRVRVPGKKKSYKQKKNLPASGGAKPGCCDGWFAA